MGRLTEYTGHGYVAYDPIDTKYDFSEINLQKLIDKLAHYEDLEEAGRLVKLPCKIGGTLYRICHEYKKGNPYIRTVVLNENNIYRIVFGGEYGKTVFLTQEEARVAMKQHEEGL